MNVRCVRLHRYDKMENLTCHKFGNETLSPWRKSINVLLKVFFPAADVVDYSSFIREKADPSEIIDSICLVRSWKSPGIDGMYYWKAIPEFCE